jgi:hypothetical protein
MSTSNLTHRLDDVIREVEQAKQTNDDAEALNHIMEARRLLRSAENELNG